MTKWTSTTSMVFLALGCSAGGSSDEGTTVSNQLTMPQGTILPGDTVPTLAPTPGISSGLIDSADLEAASDECNGTIPVVFRDFNQTHPDFEMAFSGDGVRLQLIEKTLGADDKPVFASSIGCPAQQGQQTCRTDWKVDKPVITSATTFNQWYRDVPGVNMPFPQELTLLESQPGSGLYVYSSNDFFPLKPTDGFGATPPNQGKNFLFTTEIHLSFVYVAGQRFTFRGDDDLWIFINKQLALDLGSMHGQEQGTIDFDAQAAALGIVPRQAYRMDIFHAERHTSASNFSIETNIACFTPSQVF